MVWIRAVWGWYQMDIIGAQSKKRRIGKRSREEDKDSNNPPWADRWNLWCQWLFAFSLLLPVCSTYPIAFLFSSPSILTIKRAIQPIKVLIPSGHDHHHWYTMLLKLLVLLLLKGKICAAPPSPSSLLCIAIDCRLHVITWQSIFKSKNRAERVTMYQPSSFPATDC